MSFAICFAICESSSKVVQAYICLMTKLAILSTIAIRTPHPMFSFELSKTEVKTADEIKLFRAQLNYLNMLEDYDGQYHIGLQTYRRTMDEDGAKEAAIERVKEMFGFVDIETHRQICYFILKIEEKRKSIAESEERRKKSSETAKKSQERKTFDTLMANLPNSVDLFDEIEWVKSHPALMRSASLEKGAKVVLDFKDVKFGDCPSKAAVHMLQNACNDPKEFYTKIFGKHEPRKNSEDETNVPLDKEFSLRELEEILRT